MCSGMCRWVASLLPLLLLGLAPVSARFPQLRFEHITAANALPTPSIYSILMDRQGFLWFATGEGIVRYDGRRFAAVALDSDSSHTEGSNLVYDFVESRDGTIWCATTGGGVLRYDPVHETITRLTVRTHGLSSDMAYAVCEDASGTLWVGSSGGLDTLDIVSGRFRHIVRKAGNELVPVNVKITALGEWPRRSGVLWIGTWGEGLLRFDRQREQWSAWRERPVDPHGLADGHIRTMYMPRGRPGDLWIGTEGNGFCRLDLANGKWKRASLSHLSDAGTAPWPVKHINEDPAGNLLVSTLGGGLYLFDPATDNSQRFAATPQDPFSLSHNDVRTSWVDSQGTIWVGTRNGIDKADPARGIFSIYRHVPQASPGGLSENMVYGMCQDRQGFIWVATSGGGLNRFDPERGQWVTYRQNPRSASSLATNNLTAAYIDRSGAIWTGGGGGWLHRFRMSTGTFDRWRISQRTVEGPSPSIFCIYQDREGVLWLGTIAGLMKFDPRSGTATLLVTDGLPLDRSRTSYVYSILEDRSGGFWIATGHGGVYQVDRATGVYSRVVPSEEDTGSFSSSGVRALLEDREGWLWAGTTGGGVIRFPPGGGRVETFTRRDGLSDDDIYALVEDDRGRIWIGTNRGLSAYEPKTGRWSRFDAADGLPAEMFNLGSALLCADGTLCFGGVNGLVTVRPEGLLENSHVPPIMLTALECDGARFFTGRAASYLHSVTFSSPNHVFSFEIAALDYRRPEQNTYAYRLEGVDEDWVRAGTRHFVAYSHLSPGTYTFWAKGANDSGVWSTNELALTVVVEPFWWQTLWFRIPAALAVVTLIVSVSRTRISRLRREKLAEQVFSRKLIESQEAERKRLAAELHDGLAQNLLVVKYEVQHLLDSPGGGKDGLGKISRVVQDSIEGVREISSNLHPHHLDRLGFCAALEAMTETIAHSAGITVHCTHDDIDPLLPKEKGIHVYRIIQEALSNVIRHARATEVSVEVKKSTGCIRVAVIDNGVGFLHQAGSIDFSARPPDERMHGFGLSSMSERARIIGGALTITSSPGTGTKVGLSVPFS